MDRKKTGMLSGKKFISRERKPPAQSYTVVGGWMKRLQFVRSTHKANQKTLPR